MHEDQIPDPRPWPNDRPATLAGELEAIGVPASAVPRLLVIARRESLQMVAQYLESLLERLGTTPAGKALRIALCGADRPLAEEASEVQTTKHGLAMKIGRVRRRLRTKR